jgi:hypothetical protein
MGLLWVQGLGGEARRSPDFASHRSLKPTNHKLRRAGCPRRRPPAFAKPTARQAVLESGRVEYWSIGVLEHCALSGMHP